MRRIGSIVLVICLTAGFGWSQQMPQYSQYLRNQYMVNPGSAGVYDFTDVTVSGRMQWAGFSNAPMTTYVSVCAPIGKGSPRESYNPGLRISTGLAQGPEVGTGKFKHAIGSQLFADQYGAFRKVQFSGTYAVHMPITKDINLSFGTKVGISTNTFLQDRALVANASSDNTYTNFTSNQGNKNFMNIGAGLYLYSRKLFFGVSSDQLTRDMVSFGSGTANFEPTLHTTVLGGVKVPLMNSDLTLTPSFLIKYMSPAPMTIEGTIQLEYQQAVWCGVSYRHLDAVVGMIGMNISNRLKFGYSYDFSLSKLKTYSSGGHELILGIMLR
jgi:type IX secretion system PorP/SprF family membrane protein